LDLTKIIVAHPDDDILFFAPEIFRAENPSITYVFNVPRMRLLGVVMAHLITGFQAKRVYLNHPWEPDLSFDLDSEEVWTHDPHDPKDNPHHLWVAEAVLRDAKGRVRLFTGYSLPDKARSVYGLDYWRKAAMWVIYSLFDSRVHTFSPFYTSCFGRCQSVYA
jgi:hypothetical protein